MMGLKQAFRVPVGALVLLLLYSLGLGLPPAEAKKQFRVLLINSYHDGMPWTRNIVRGVRQVFGRSGESIQLRVEYLDTKFVPADAALHSIWRELLTKKYDNQELDLILTSDDDALNFVMSYRQELFPGVPIIFAGVNFLDPLRFAPGSKVSGVVETLAVRETVGTAFRLHPQARRLVVINDRSTTGQANRKLVEQELSDLRTSHQIDFWDDLTMEELLERVATLSPDTIVLLLTFNRDRNGRAWSYTRSLNLIRRRCPAPLYGLWSFYLGHGIVGGRLAEGLTQGRLAARLGLQVMKSPEKPMPPFVTRGPTRYMFDRLELQRFGVSLDHLPQHALIINRPPTVVVVPRTMVWGTLTGLAAALIAALVLAVNIRRRQQAEESLRAREERYRTLLENASDAVYTINPKLEFTWVNAAMEKILGYSREEIIGRDAVSFVVAADQSSVRSNLHRKLQEGVSTLYRLKIRTRSGETRELEIHSGPVVQGGRVAEILGVMRDLTDRQREEERFQRAQRLELAGKIAGGVAHDANNLLSVILGEAQLMQLTVTDRPRVIRSCNSIREACQRMGDLHDDLLTLGRRGHVQREPLSLSDVLRATERDFRQRYGDFSIELHFPASPLPAVAGSSSQLQRVCFNLFRNAREAGAKRVEVHCEVLVMGADPLRRGLAPGPWLLAIVSDDGPGIPAEIRPQIFDPYFSTKNLSRRAGSGLGLAIVKGVMEDHGGLIEVGDWPGGGARFSLYLPALPTPLLPKDPLPQEAIPGSERLLIVEDQPSQRELLAGMLTKIGYAVRTAGSTREAVEVLMERETDLLILDMLLGDGESGLDVFRQMVALSPEVKVIVVSGFAETDQVKQILNASKGIFLRKPTDIHQLTVAIRRLLDHPQN